MTDFYHQCWFEKNTDDGLEKKVGWIEKRGAKIGALVELKGEEGLWLVTKVSDVGVDHQEYLKRISKGRTKFASIQGGN